MDKPAFKQLHAQLVKRPPVESLRATGGCTLEIHRQVLKGRLRGQRADASTCHAEAFAADSCSDLLVFLLDMNNAPFVIDSVFISLSLIKGAYQRVSMQIHIVSTLDQRKNAFYSIFQVIRLRKFILQVCLLPIKAICQCNIMTLSQSD